VDLSEYEGQAIRMPLATRDRDVIVLVPSEGSDARRDGWDFMFITCSERCASTMKAVMEDEVLLGTVLFGKIEKKGTRGASNIRLHLLSGLLAPLACGGGAPTGASAMAALAGEACAD
jgi:hypothetical protein